MHQVLNDPARQVAKARFEADYAAGESWRRQMAAGISAATLTVAEKNLVWRHIKACCPEQRAFLADPDVQLLMKTLGAVPVFDPALVRAALGQGGAA